MNLNVSAVYQIRHVESGKVYIGSAVCIRERWTAHKRELQQGRHHSQYLQRAWVKYGAQAFVFEVLELCAADMLIIMEQHYLNVTQAADTRFGFNICAEACSTRGRFLSEAAKKSIATKLRNKWRDPVYRANNVTRVQQLMQDPSRAAKMASSKRGSTGSDKQRAWIAAYNRQRWGLEKTL